MVNREILEKFKRLYKEKYDIVLSDEEATEKATTFLNVMKILIYPEPKILNTQETAKEERQNETERL